MQLNVCFAYSWATFGGVERVMLNRAHAFRQYFPGVRADFYFTHDSGGLGKMAKAIKSYGLGGTSRIVTSLSQDYDFVSVIDSPRVVDECIKRSMRFVVECHTAYSVNRAYLAKLAGDPAKVLTPSNRFSSLLAAEFPKLSGRLGVLRNFVPWDIQQRLVTGNCLPCWARRPILFFGRLDRLKDPLSLLEAFRILDKRRPGEFMLLFCGPRMQEIDIDREISKRSLRGISVVLPPIPFSNAGWLLSSVAHSGGVFVSPSKGESFGLSAAEALSSLLPVVLSNIEPHVELVGEYKNEMTYRLGDVEDMATHIEWAIDNHADAISAAAELRNAFSAKLFVEDWERLVGELGMAV